MPNGVRELTQPGIIADILRELKRLRRAVTASQLATREYDKFTLASSSDSTHTLTYIPSPSLIPIACLNGLAGDYGTDYTVDFTTGIVTWSATKAAGDVLGVFYQTTGDLAAFSAPVDYGSLVDTFNRADSGSSLGTSSGGWTWNTWSFALTAGFQTSVWGISSNQAYLTSVVAPGGTVYAAVAYPSLLSSADGTLDLDLPTVVTGKALAAFRFDTTQATPSNRTGWLIYPTQALWLGAGAGGSVVGSTFTTGFSSGDHLTLVMSGSSLTIKRNGSTVWSASDTRNQTIKTVGMASTDITARYDNFSWDPA